MSEALEEFLKVKTYEEYNRRRQEFKEKGLSAKEPGVLEHLGEICPYVGDEIRDGIIYEAF